VVTGHGVDAKLVAFVVPTHSAAYDAALERSLLEVLCAQLPEYMVPGRVIRLQALPLTSNGKLDRRALVTLAEETASPVGDGEARDSYVAARTETETIVARIWAEVLKKERVGVTDNFFALGGHSLSAIRVLGKLSREFKQRLPLRAIFESPTVAALSLVIEQARGGSPAEQ
jgi:acyl carrier protein